MRGIATPPALVSTSGIWPSAVSADGRRHGRSYEPNQDIDLVPGDQLLRQTLADFRIEVIVTIDDFDADASGQVGHVQLGIEIDALLHLVPWRREEP